MTPSPDPNEKDVTPLQCIIGGLISGGLATLFYLLDRNIINTFAAKPLPDTNITATNIAVAVRTLVMGGVTLVTALFAIAGLGLLLLAIQTAFQGSPENES
ncbi:DUF3082 domain-containing protein [Spirulina sp. CS-785/01]|uniref:DUF3082 domain-containing protein n=1 Tax=Spirulina sp. CS-785/01 TaxID=3021716 RepID=UPI0023300DE1|nr:DUF3082 domain-containing protein [Spirulina sp. CS-785/01]MDB9312860.1 DUF3082 domain-containing protein [Spirulina sp. CS-785/01]